MSYSFKNIASIIQGRILQETTDPALLYVLYDSRKLSFPSSTIFFALVTKRGDGHKFISSLYESGVRNFVICKDISYSSMPDANIVWVDDTLKGLQLLATTHRRRFSIPVVGITGSNGKTVVKEWLAAILESSFKVVKSPKSHNSQVGVPLSIWQMSEMHQLGIFEAGISLPGEMKELEKIIQPTIGIFTNIGDAHSGGFEDILHKAREKMKLFLNADSLIYCTDYEPIQTALEELQQIRMQRNIKPIFEFSWSSMGKPAYAKVTISKNSKTQTQLVVNIKETDYQYSIPFSDMASIENCIHCICFSLLFDLNLEQVNARLLSLTRIAMRLELRQGINNCSVINDSYSADLGSLRIALDFLSAQKQHTKRTLILSDILETGKNAEGLYQEVAEALEIRKVYRIICIGTVINQNKSRFSSRGIETIGFESVSDFKKHFHQLSFENEAILVKGARIFALEELSRMLEKKTHETVLEIDLNALLHNLHQYQAILKPGTLLMAMVKAFSYGSGSYEIANLLQFHHVDYLAVAYPDEGVELRKGGITLPIMVMNTDDSAFDTLINYNLEPEIYSIGLLKEFYSYLNSHSIKSFPIHIEIETGMNRLGFRPDEMDQLIELATTDRFLIKTVFTHLVASESEAMDDVTAGQAETFRQVVLKLKTAIPYPFITHIANSAGIARHPELQQDMVRLGIGLYGIGTAQLSAQLREVSTLKSTIAQIKHIKKGETVGYGKGGTVHRDSVIATVRIGYADGYPRSLSYGRGKMLVQGQLVAVVGTVCMDMTMLDITDLEGVEEGDEVQVFGAGLPVKDLANWADTIPYEILTGISQRVKRVYFQE